MARQLKVDGIEDISRTLEKLGKQAGAVASHALYVGAGIVADAVQKSVDSIETEPFRMADETHPRKCSPQEKTAMSRSIAGIAKFDKEGAEVSTSVGLKNAGYVNLAGKKVPLPLIARSINSGTTFRIKQPFFRQAVTRVRGKASNAIAAEVEKAVDKLLK